MRTLWPMLGYFRELAQENRKLRVELEGLQAELDQNSANCYKSPNPFTRRPAKPQKAQPRKKRNGVRQQCLRPTEITELHTGSCSCGCSDLIDLEPCYIHQHIVIPEPRLNVEHIILCRGRCSLCGRMVKALVPPEGGVTSVPDFRLTSPNLAASMETAAVLCRTISCPSSVYPSARAGYRKSLIAFPTPSSSIRRALPRS